MNVNELDFEQITLLDQMVCTGRQLKFKVLRTNRRKIGMNESANKLYPLNDLVALDLLEKSFVHLKKIMKIQFLKYGKT